MAAVLFKAKLVDEEGKSKAELARIVFGVESIGEKEQSFRAICKQKYPHLHIVEPIIITPAREP